MNSTSAGVTVRRTLSTAAIWAGEALTMFGAGVDDEEVVAAGLHPPRSVSATKGADRYGMGRCIGVTCEGRRAAGEHRFYP